MRNIKTFIEQHYRSYVLLADKIYKRITQHIATANDTFFKDENTFNLDGTMRYVMQIMYYLCWKKTIPSKHQYVQPFRI